jgi:hypothetical protein
MNEWAIIAIVPVCAALFAIGGTGFKWVRRYVLPAGLGLLGAFLASWWQGLGYALTLCLFLCMGYGDRCPWWRRVLIFTGYGLSALWFGWSWWVLVIPVACSGLFLLSNLKPTASSFVWKLAELSMGFLIGCGFVSSIINSW